MKHIYTSVVILFILQLSFGQIGFEKNIISNIADGARSVHSVDLDNDGDLDVLSASVEDDKVAWYENIDGLGTFGAQQVISANLNFANTVYAADIDGDGDNDVFASSGLDDKVVWFENINGQGDFGDEQIIDDNLDYASSVFVIDVDGDNDFDVLSAGLLESKIVWYENLDGLGAFGTQQVILSGILNVGFVSSGDFDNDGDNDVFFASYQANDAGWIENINGLGTFGLPNYIGPNNTDGAREIISADIDGDFDNDFLIVSEDADKISWYENLDGQGNFGTEQIVAFTNNPDSAYVTDLDNDGDLDVITADRFDDLLSWYENTDGLGSFGPRQVISNTADGISDVFAADINNDGLIDILSASQTDENVVWHENLGVFNKITGSIQVDVDANGCSVSGVPTGNIMVTTNDGTQEISVFSLNNGVYQLFEDEGEYMTSIANLPAYYSSNPISQTSNFTGLGNTDTIDFCIEPIDTINDLNISVYPSINEPRPGFDTTYQIVYNNVGTTQLSGSVIFAFNETKIQFLSASETVFIQGINAVIFEFQDLNPFETRTIDLEFNVFEPPITEINDQLISQAAIAISLDDDINEEDNLFTLEQTVIGSYDPNDITCLEGEQIFIEDADKYLHYLIRFQNTGTASAIHVRVENVLDDKLDWTTMQLENLSHTGRVEILNGSEVSFIFDNINLPDSSSDEPNSHGFIAYKIIPKDNVVLGDIFDNTADIYFDFNPPIITNTVSTEIVEDLLSVSEFEEELFSVFPNPTNSKLTIQSKLRINEINIIEINGRLLNTFDVSNQNEDITINVENLSNGIYFLKIQAKNKEQTIRFIKN